MNTEFEVKVIIDHELIRSKLRLLGATMVRPMGLMRRLTFYLPMIDGKQRWLRVRDEGEYSTLTFKSLDATKQIDCLKELEVKISDFEIMILMLNQLGYQSKMYVENYREIWKLDSCLIMLDLWPWLDPLIEVEGDSQELVMQAVHRLGLDGYELHYGTSQKLYCKKYGVSAEEFDGVGRLTAQEKPA